MLPLTIHFAVSPVDRSLKSKCRIRLLKLSGEKAKLKRHSLKAKKAQEYVEIIGIHASCAVLTSRGCVFFCTNGNQL